MNDIIINNCELHPHIGKLDISFISRNRPSIIYIDNQKSFICKNESAKTYTYQINTNDWTADYSQNVYYTYETTIALDLTTAPFELDSDLLLVYIYTDIKPDPEGEYPDGGDLLEAVVPVYSEYHLYKNVFDTLKNDFKDCNNKCSNHEESANKIIMFNGVEYSIAVGDYKRATYYWDLIHDNRTNSSNGCNCKS